MKDRIPSFLLEKQPSHLAHHRVSRPRGSFIEKGMRHFAEIIRTSYLQWESASAKGLFQKLDARIKVLFLVFFILLVSLKRTILPEATIGAFVLLLAVASRLDLVGYCKRVLFLGLLFGFLITLPSALNIITEGTVILPLIRLSNPRDFWIYHIPQEIGITEEGLLGVALLTLRVMNSIGISLLVLHTTPFPEVIKALKVLRVPDAFLIILTLSYKYIFIFAKTAEDMHLAKKSRLLGAVSTTGTREWIAGRIAFLFRKTQLRCEEIFKAMQGRGFSGTIRLYGFKKMARRDWLMGSALLLIGVAFLLM